MVWEDNARRPGRANVVGPVNFVAWRERSTRFERMGASYDTTLNLTGSGEPEEHVASMDESRRRRDRDLVEPVVLEPEQAHVGRIRIRTDDQVQQAAIGGLRAIGRRWDGRRVRMRVVETDDLEAATARRAPGVDVLLRIDDEPVRIVREVAGADRLDDRLAAAEQDAAAFGRRRLARVREDVVERVPRDRDRYSASTAIAMPIPPPMHSAATP